MAVSVAKPSTHVVNGQEMATSIIRSASQEPIFFDLDGPAGNATAMHTEQVCVFCTERYDHWSNVLGIERTAWKDCQFGENLLIEGLTEEDVHIGDRLRTAGGVLFEVTGCRSNCAKLTWRMGAPPSFLRTLVAAGWIGYYLRVLEPGWVSAGDDVTIEIQCSGQPSIAALTRAIHEQDDPDLGFLRAAMSSHGLGAQTRQVLKTRICDVEDLTRTHANRWKGWRRFLVVDRRQEAPDVVSLSLEPADGGPIAFFRAGQFVSVRLPEAAGSIVRNWSLSDYHDRDDGYRVTIKREPGGIGSNWAQSVEPGTVVDLRSPAGQFVLDRSTLRRVILISAGIGLTPMFAMLKAHAARGADASPIIWIHSTRSSETMVFGPEVDELLAVHPTFTRQLHFTAPLPGDVIGRDFEHPGRITGETVKQITGRSYDLLLIGRPVEVPGYNNEVYICGPRPFEQAIRRVFEEAGTVPHYIRSEAFHPAQADAGQVALVEESEVRFEPAGTDCRWSMDDDLPLLDLAINAGLEPDYSCRTGQCGSCVARLLAGEVRQHPAPRMPLNEGEILLCCARPQTATVRVLLRQP